MVMPLGNEERPASTSWATYLLIAANLAAFAATATRPESTLIAAAATPYEITHGVDIVGPFRYQPEPTAAGGEPTADAAPIVIDQAPGPRPIGLTVVSAMFLHANLVHLLGNMLFLFIFGRRIEEAFGRPTFLGFYLACGVVGTLAQVAAVPDSLTPILGASGAIAGVMGAYLVWFPRDRVRVLFLNVVALVPASGVIGCWIAVQLVRGRFLTGAVAQEGHVAYLSHLGGAAAGALGGLWIRVARRDPRPR